MGHSCATVGDEVIIAGPIFFHNYKIQIDSGALCKGRSQMLIILHKILKMLNICISHYGTYVVLNKVTLQAVSILYYVCFLLGIKKYLLIPRVWKISRTGNMWHFFTLFGSFWYLAFKVTKKTFFVKIELCGKNVRFLNISENKKGKSGLILFVLSFLGILSVCPDILHDQLKYTK